MTENKLDQALGALGRLAWRRPWSFVFAALMLTLALGGLAWTLPVDSSFMGILDDDDPAMVRLAEVSRRFGAASSVVLVITGGEEAERREVAEQAVEVLESLDLVEDASARIDPEFVRQYGLIYLDDASFSRLEQGLTTLRPTLLTLQQTPTLEAGLAALLQPQPEGSVKGAPPDAAETLNTLAQLLEWLADPDPQRLDSLLAARLTGSAAIGEGGTPLREGWIASADGSMYAVDARTRLDPLSVDIGMSGFGGIEAAIDPLRAQHPNMQMRFAGLLPGGYEDQQNVLGKVMPLSTLSLILVLICLAFVDRRLGTALAVGVALVTSLVWTLGLVRLTFGYASLMVSAFAIMLFGLGVDYSVHLVARYNDERVAGHSGEDAMSTALARTGRSIIVGALTTMVAFALMSLTDFKAAVHLGVTAAMGLGCSCVLMVVFLPPIIALMDRGPSARYVSMDLPWLDWLVSRCLAHPRRVGLVCLGVVLGTAALSPRFRLETDLEKIITQDLPALKAAQELAKAFGGSAEAIFSLSDSLELSRERAEAFAQLPGVARVDGLHRLIPADTPARLTRNQALRPLLDGLNLPETARDRVPTEALGAELERLRKQASRVALEAQAGGRLDIVPAARRLRDAAAALQASLPGREVELAQAEAELLRRLRLGLDGMRGCADIETFGPEQLPASLRDRYYKDGRFLSLVYPRDYRIEFEMLQDFKKQVLSVDPEATGTLLVVDQLLMGGVNRLPFSLACITLALALILWWDLRSLIKVGIAMVPLFLGCTMAVGLVLLLQMKVSILMLAAFPLLFGIGIDDGVHILHRWEERSDDMVAAIADTGKAILFTSVTTAIGFSILFLLEHKGLEGLGALVCLGVIACFLTSVTVLPVLAVWAHKKGWA